jgi:membrane protein implicated in regulation of membrane protease activity
MFLDLLNNWLFYYQIWIIIGVIFLFLELTDGSLIICLPLGISAFLISFFVFISNNNLINDWYILLFLWAILSVIASYLLTKFWKKDH